MHAPESPPATGLAARTGLLTFLLVLAALALSLQPNLARLAYDGGATPTTVLATRAALAAVVLFAIAAAKGTTVRLGRRTTLGVLTMGAMLALQSYGLMGSVAYIPVSLAILLMYTYPFQVALVARLVGGERLGAAKLLALVAAFAGLVLALDPAAAVLDWRGVALALFGAVMITLTIVGAGRIKANVGSTVLTTYMNGVTAVVLGAAALASGGLQFPESNVGMLALAAQSCLWVFGVWCFYTAVGILGGPTVSIVMNCEPVFAIIAATLLLGETLTGGQGLGAVLVIGAVFVVRWADLRRARG